ncbi:hypothetical protein Taro_014413 [Colocasia esculenta]|uniref:Uncharacterized protein n=1 Tax=Colocasia esculenta TaxID=4460 RepID=A0A843UIR2_COLES|nr:hypothetical protein [Colocasia esculenta]
MPRGSSSQELGVRRVAEVAVVSCVVSSSESEYCELLSVGGDANFGVPGGGPGGRVVIVCGFPASFVCALQWVAAITVSLVWRVWSLGVFVPWWCGWRWTCWQWSSLYGGQLQASPGAVLLAVFGTFGCVCVAKAERACVWCGLHRCRVVVCGTGLRYVVVLAGAFWRVFLERCLGGSGGGSPRTSLLFFLMVCVVWVVHFGEGSSQDRPLSLLVEVLPRNAFVGEAPLWRSERGAAGELVQSDGAASWSEEEVAIVIVI